MICNRIFAITSQKDGRSYKMLIIEVRLNFNDVCQYYRNYVEM